MIKSFSFSLLFIVFVARVFSQELITDSITRDASFPGGEIALSKFIKDNMIIPELCLNEGKTGLVYVRFTVDTTGKISDIQIDSNQTNCKNYEMEAKRIVQLMPNWIPGKIEGNPVKISYLLPITFGFTEADTPEKKTEYVEPNWAGIELGITQLMNTSFEPTFNLNRYWENVVEKSWFFNYNFFEYKLPIYKQYLGLTTGMGYSWRGISFLSNYDLIANSDTVYANTATADLRRNKLTAHYLTLPLLLEFCTKKDTDKNFYISSGVIGSWKFSSYTYQKGKDLNGNNFSHYTYSNYNLRNFNLDWVLRLGYSYVGLFTSYQINTLFKKDKTVPIYPIRIGMTINMDYFQE
jgi:hypothetical protein